MTITIPDVSNYQGNVNWQAVIASGRAGGICKATEGGGYTDPTFGHNWATLGALNAQRGAYHFGRADQGSGVSQAQRFMNVVGPTKPTDVLVLDMEVGNGYLSAWALDFLHTVHNAGHIAMLYSYAPFITAHLQDPALAEFPLWIAAYQSSPPACPRPWSSFTLWQHTDKASIPGIPGACDESIGTLPGAPSPAPTAPSGGIVVNAPMVALLPHQGGGYIEVCSDGGVFAFGPAPMFGSLGGMHLNAPVVGACWTKTQAGYWMVAADGGVFNFGDAAFHGSMGGKTLNKPIIGMACSDGGQGYFLYAQDGGVFSFGDAQFIDTVHWNG